MSRKSFWCSPFFRHFIITPCRIYSMIMQNATTYGGPQQSQQQQITHSNNKFIATITKTSHQNQIAHSTNKMLTAQTKTLTAQRKTLTAPPNRGGLLCLFLDLKKDGQQKAIQHRLVAFCNKSPLGRGLFTYD